MPLTKNEFPILEYDSEEKSLIMPNRNEHYSFPEYAVFPFLGDEVEAFAREKGLKEIGVFENITKNYPIYELSEGGRKICLCGAPMGSAAAVQLLDFLIACGAENIISTGSCGTLEPIEENEFLIPVEALRAEGTSYHYLPPARTVKAGEKAVAALEKALEENSVPYEECRTWTTDGFFRETKEMTEYRRSEGFSVVEMECAGLFACAEFRKVNFGMLLFTADSLADTSAHDDRNWGLSAYRKALELCINAVKEF